MSWFYESGGISPIPVVLPRLSNLVIDLHENKEELSEYKESDEETETVGYTKRQFCETEISMLFFGKFSGEFLNNFDEFCDNN